eukprot:365813-Chlamydomonas_euryale.AAC.14
MPEGRPSSLERRLRFEGQVFSDDTSGCRLMHSRPAHRKRHTSCDHSTMPLSSSKKRTKMGRTPPPPIPPPFARPDVEKMLKILPSA